MSVVFDLCTEFEEPTPSVRQAAMELVRSNDVSPKVKRAMILLLEKIVETPDKKRTPKGKGLGHWLMYLHPWALCDLAPAKTHSMVRVLSSKT